MRRLYSTFAGSWPGAGLLLLRLVVGSVLLLRGGANAWNDGPWHATLGLRLARDFGGAPHRGTLDAFGGCTVAVIETARVLAMGRTHWSG